nr:hypothetical protein [Tanacetum cinerariifolium]
MPRCIDGGIADVGEGLVTLAVLPLLTSYSGSVSMVDYSSEFNVRFLKRLVVSPDLLTEWMVRGDEVCIADVGEGLVTLAVLPLLTSYSGSVSMVDYSSEFNVRFLKRLVVSPDLLTEWMVRGDEVCDIL